MTPGPFVRYDFAEFSGPTKKNSNVILGPMAKYYCDYVATSLV